VTKEENKWDPIIVGPWMDMWDIEKHEKGLPNRHTDSYLASPPETRDPLKYINEENW